MDIKIGALRIITLTFTKDVPMDYIEQPSQPVPVAFLSCSLRTEDEPFVNHVCDILWYFGIELFGTVGKFDASPENPMELMRRNIAESDFIVVCVTSRYKQEDVKTGAVSTGMSEMLHAEVGMAHALGKPVVAFVQEGTSPGNVLPNITQYMVLSGAGGEFDQKEQLICSLLNNAWQIALNARSEEDKKKLGNFLLKSLAVIGGYAIVRSMGDR